MISEKPSVRWTDTMQEQARVNRVVRTLQRASRPAQALAFAVEASKLLEEMHTRLRRLAADYVDIQE